MFVFINDVAIVVALQKKAHSDLIVQMWREEKKNTILMTKKKFFHRIERKKMMGAEKEVIDVKYR